MRKIKYLVALLLLSVLFSCNKDKLTGNYDAFEGKYEWMSTGANKDAWTHASITPLETGYSVHVEFNNTGEVLFYKNNSLISSNTYSLVDKSTVQGGVEIMIKLKGETTALNISDNKLTVRLHADTSLEVDRFPFPAIDDAANYFQDYSSTNNNFVRIE